jgi:hypothetical protein
MSLPGKTDVYYIVREEGEVDQVFADQPSAFVEFNKANKGRKKIAIKCTVVYKRIQQITDQEI